MVVARPAVTVVARAKDSAATTEGYCGDGGGGNKDDSKSNNSKNGERSGNSGGSTPLPPAAGGGRCPSPGPAHARAGGRRSRVAPPPPHATCTLKLKMFWPTQRCHQRRDSAKLQPPTSWPPPPLHCHYHTAANKRPRCTVATTNVVLLPSCRLRR